MEYENKTINADGYDVEDLDLSAFDEFEQNLENQLTMKEEELKALKKDFEQIGSASDLGEKIQGVVWEQFCNQIATVAGEDFIKENRGMTLDLRDSAHIQTTENFANGKLATHNTEIDYQERHDAWQKNFQKDANGNIIMHDTRNGKKEATLVKGARDPFDKDRPSGSVEKNTDMDHTVSAGEIIRDPEANAHLTKEEQIGFANSGENLYEMDAKWNRSKGDTPTPVWLDNPNKNGQKPNEIFDDLTPEEEKKLREKDEKAREEWEKRKKEGEKRSVEAGKKSQKEEALRVGKAELKSILMRMLTDLLKQIIQKLIAWFGSAKRGLASLIADIKNVFISFARDFKTHIVNAADSFVTSLATALWGPIVRVLKKIWTTLKQAWGSVKEAWNFLRDPRNSQMPFSLKIMEVGKIVITGLTAMGAVVLGQGLETGLLAIPVVGPFLAIEIPLFGSIASLLSIFLGAVIAGILGAIVINWIQKKIEYKLKASNLSEQVTTGNEAMKGNLILEMISQGKSETIKGLVAQGMIDRRNSLDSKIKGFEQQRMIDDSVNLAETEEVQDADDGATRLQNTNDGLKGILKAQ